MRSFYWHDVGWEDYLYWQEQDKKTLKKINDLLKDVERNGYKCKGKPEPLTGNYAGYWSLRIDKKNRLIFRINNGMIEIAECRSHYDDK